ncbi:iron complex transport system permease protein [Trichococcus ilyis]|uniref:Abc transporter permease protein n=1 Tax=Trichococcus ilyis TaxID=640938 RepID=A0A143Z0Y7_9LACT|nr:abc transporter permease protein [Trichococcus ilyis]SEJ25788.1 iron complex transport system permease protein [Trichococcus ilyis]
MEDGELSLKKLLFVLAVAAAVLLSLGVGTAAFSMEQLLAGNSTDRLILVSSRLPRTITVLLAGAGLALSGLVMQALTQNRFAAPDTVGTVDAAKVGMLCGMVFFPSLSVMGKMALSFSFAAAGTFLFLIVVNRLPFKSQMTIPLLGLMYGNILGGIANFFAFRFNVTQNLSAWMQGNFSLVIKGQYEGMYLIFLLSAALYFFADHLTIARFGKDAAKNLGLPFEAVLFIGTLFVSLAVAVILSTVGNLPFLGVIIPNLVSLRFGDNVRSTHGKTALFGAIFLLLCDVFSRSVIPPYEIPVETVLGVFGGGLFLWLLLRGGRPA